MNFTYEETMTGGVITATKITMCYIGGNTGIICCTTCGTTGGESGDEITVADLG